MRMRGVALLLTSDSEQRTEILKNPRIFEDSNCIDKQEPRASDRAVYVAVPAKTWNLLQDFIDENNLRDEARKTFNGHWTVEVPTTHMLEI